MNSEKEKLLYSTYERFMDKGLGRTNPDKIDDIVSQEIMGFGSTADEKIFGVEGLLKLIKIQREQNEGLDMIWEIEPVNRYVNSDENLAVFADDVHLTTDINGEKIKMYLRFSAVLEYKNDKWIIIHFHGSKPEDDRSEEDTFGMENWKQKLEKLEKIVAERTADLEGKNRELEIEAALEKVRSRSLAMHKSEEMPEVVNIVYERILELNIEIDNAIVIILKENSPELEYWIASPGQNYPTMLHIPRTDKTVVLKGFQAARDAGENISLSYPFEVKNELWNYLFEETDFRTMQEERKKLLLESKGYSTSISFEKNTALQANRFSAKSFLEDENKILKRFAKVFEQAYTRFLDLQKAEAQALEATKQASLDRVRGEIASMRSTEDLQRITPLIFKELTILDVPFFRCGVFIINESEHIVHAYLTAPDGHSLGVLKLGFDSNDLTANAVKYWREGKVYHQHWSKEEFINWTKSMIKMGQVQNTGSYQGASAPPDKLDLHFVPFTQGMLYVGNSNQLTNSEINLVKSLAEAFSIAYARYEDFVKLEQAKQSIENTLSELKAAQKQLVQSEKMASLGELTAGIAHEIQNPLNFVNNFSEVSNELIDEMNEELAKGDIEEAKAIAADVKQNLIKINHHGKRAGDIVKGMLQHSRTSTGTKEPTDINALADEYLRLSYHGLRAKDKLFNATMKTDFDDDLFANEAGIGKINIIPQDIGRVLLNLYNNAFYSVNKLREALYASDSERTFQPIVSIKTQKINEKVIITVCDNGNGIPQNIVDKIFQPFFTTKPTGQGTGLGLSLSYDIIKAHGGEIKVESQEGEGTKFVIELPVV